MLMDQNREKGSRFQALLQSIMSMISRDPAAAPSGRGSGIPSITETLMNPGSSTGSVAPRLPMEGPPVNQNIPLNQGVPPIDVGPMSNIKRGRIRS